MASRRSEEEAMTTEHPRMNGPPISDRVLSETRALCPTCLRVVAGRNIERDGKVYLSRSCSEHGEFDSLVLSDATWWEWSRRFIRPGR
jgi:uncharacterized radical SAM superfamily Fe-S cluster-containing enzyme